MQRRKITFNIKNQNLKEQILVQALARYFSYDFQYIDRLLKFINEQRDPEFATTNLVEYRNVSDEDRIKIKLETEEKYKDKSKNELDDIADNLIRNEARNRKNWVNEAIVDSFGDLMLELIAQKVNILGKVFKNPYKTSIHNQLNENTLDNDKVTFLKDLRKSMLRVVNYRDNCEFIHNNAMVTNNKFSESYESIDKTGIYENQKKFATLLLCKFDKACEIIATIAFNSKDLSLLQNMKLLNPNMNDWQNFRANLNLNDPKFTLNVLKLLPDSSLNKDLHFSLENILTNVFNSEIKKCNNNAEKENLSSKNLDVFLFLKEKNTDFEIPEEFNNALKERNKSDSIWVLDRGEHFNKLPRELKKEVLRFAVGNPNSTQIQPNEHDKSK